MRQTVIENLSERVAAIEQELARLKQHLQAEKPQVAAPWWQQISGAFKDCPEFDEAMRLEREWRQSQRMSYDEDDTETTVDDHDST